MSDTHNYLDETIFRHFEMCDEIWHAGDFGDIGVADKIAAFRPLKGVYGNIDGYDVRSVHPELARWKCNGVEVMMCHIGGYPGKYSTIVRHEMKSSPPKLFISGHSHILKIQYDKTFDCLHINPGAAGKEGWHKVRTIVKFSIDGTEIRNCEVIELHPRWPKQDDAHLRT